MNTFHRPGIYAGLTSLVLMSALAAPALAQTKTFPPGTDCSKLSGADMTACQAQMASQQKDGTVGNGTPAGTLPDTSTGLGNGNQLNNAVPGVTGPNGTNGQNGTTGSPNGTTNNSNP